MKAFSCEEIIVRFTFLLTAFT